MNLICPVCNEYLIIDEIDGIEIDVCKEGCKGIWFDSQELKELREESINKLAYEELRGKYTPKPIEEAVSESLRTCPRCEIKLYRYRWARESEILIDLCHKCYGIWLDYGELKGIDDYQKAHTKRKIESYDLNLLISPELDAIVARKPYSELKPETKERILNNLLNTISKLPKELLASK